LEEEVVEVSEIDDLLDGANTKAGLLEALKDSTSMFVSWRKPDGTWDHGWYGAGYENIGHVQYAIHDWMLEADAKEAEDES
jgi:hypothetical protein